MADTRLQSFTTPIEWQIDRRHLISKLTAKLHAFLHLHSEFHREGPNQWHPMVRMVDIAFSLWRSAFLTDVKRERHLIHSHMTEFVRKVIETNAISFADDQRLCELTVGYYNSNARYRLERMLVYNPELFKYKSMKTIDNLKDNESLKSDNQRELWDIYYLALCDCLEYFEKEWDAKVRPKGGTRLEPQKTPQPISVAGSTGRSRRSRLGL